MEIILKYKHILVITAILLMWTCISACSSQESSKPQTEQQRASERLPVLSGAAVSTKAAPVGFDSAESAVKAYLLGLKASDFKRMADTFSAENNVDDILCQYTILCGMDLNPNDCITLKDSENIKQFLEKLKGQMEAVDFGSMKLLGFIPPDSLSDAYSTDAHQNNMVKMAEKYGGENIESCVAAIELGKKKYILFFDVLERDGQWFNLQLGGILANMTGVERGIVGTIPLDTEDEKTLKKLMPDLSQNLFELGTEEINVEEPSTFIVESEGFDSPQEAAKAYLGGLKSNDIDQMISAFSVESYVDHYNLQASLEYVQGYFFMQQELNLPVVNDFSRDLNIQSRKKYIIKDIIKQYAALFAISRTDLSDANGMEEDYISTISAELPEFDLSSMKILGYLPPESLSEVYGSERSLDIRTRRAKVCGANRMESCVVVFELKGERYCFCTDAVEYKDKWYIKQLGGQISTLLTIPVNLVGIMPVSELDKPEIELLIIPK
ncbi:hypothetical protein [Clostridium sp. E02]|uniref:hypothetical protein n=1 Tax=Clostridium sp. E02 TaxID=2487134 RepID=UPI000F53EE43|nr:hypothetical protein [Clostridium sp. E02]